MGSAKKIVFEAGMLNLCDRRTSTEDDMADRISLLESNWRFGSQWTKICKYPL